MADQNKWEKYDEVYKEYSNILSGKIGKIDFYDLLLVRNFKGGGATIANTIKETNQRLVEYNKLFLLVNNDYENNKQVAERLMDLVDGDKTKISGFKYSYLSALMSLLFPKTYPIMDKYVLYGTGILKDYRKNTQDEMNKENFIKLLEFYKQNKSKTLRELDKEYFNKGKKDEKKLKELSGNLNNTKIK